MFTMNTTTSTSNIKSQSSSVCVLHNKTCVAVVVNTFMPHTQRNRPKTNKRNDPFLFYSNTENLERTRNFQDVSNSSVGGGEQGEERRSRRSTTASARKTRISFEKDALSLMLEAMEIDEEMWRVDGWAEKFYLVGGMEFLLLEY